MYLVFTPIEYMVCQYQCKGYVDTRSSKYGYSSVVFRRDVFRPRFTQERSAVGGRWGGHPFLLVYMDERSTTMTTTTAVDDIE